MNREEQAKIEIGNTTMSKRAAVCLTVFFLSIIFMVPLIQGMHEGIRFFTGETGQLLPSILDIYSVAISSSVQFARDDAGPFKKIMNLNTHLLDGIISYEDSLENESVFRAAVIPPIQQVFTQIFTLGNEKVVIGKDGWLFYEPGIHYLTTNAGEQGSDVNRSSSKANTLFKSKKTVPLDAITDFNRQLYERGITLILLPVPVKPMFYPDKISGLVGNTGGYLQNPGFNRLESELRKENILVFDAAEFLHARRNVLKNPSFLKTDSHWSPEAATLVAKGLADMIEDSVDLSGVNNDTLYVSGQTVTNTGDIARMLSLPAGSKLIVPESATIRQILINGDTPWQSGRDAEILFLGDSFANIYSAGNMGWGESAGIVEQLSYILDRPVDRIIQNDNGAYATRQSLQHEMARGRDRLLGKKVVIWEFAIREIVLGDWKKLELKLNIPEPARFFVPDNGEEVIATGTVYNVSARPVPKTTPYKDHIMTFHIVDLSVHGQPDEKFSALVYAYSMKDYELTAMAHYRTGQELTLRLKNWFDVIDEYDSINRAEIDDDELLLEDPCWSDGGVD